MKIISLRFSNLNSLHGEWLIDFTHPQFADNGLFAITGPTGAGKTTILDAICLALYHQTPRLGNITVNNNEIMSRGTATCSAEVIFEINGDHYRASWSMRRSRDKVDGKLQNAQCELAKMNVSEADETITTRIDEKIKHIESLSGLNFDRFNKSMMLSQGKFAEFLNASENDRAELLEELTGTEIYSRISMHVHQQFTQAKQMLQSKIDKASAYQLLDDNDVQSLQAEELALQKEQLILAQQIEEQQAYINWLNDFSKANAAVEDANQALSVLEQAYKDKAPERISLDLALQAQKMMPAWQHLCDLKDKREKTVNEISVIQQSIEKQKSIVEQSANTLQAALKQQAELETQHQKQQLLIREEAQPLEQQIESLKGRLSLTEISSAQQGEKHSTLMGELDARLAAQTKKQRELLSIENELEQKQSALLIADKIPSWKADLQQTKHLLIESTQLKQKLAQNQHQIDEYNEQNSKYLSDISHKNDELDKLKASLKTAQNQLAEALLVDGSETTPEKVEAELKDVSRIVQHLPELTLSQTRYEEIARRIESNEQKQKVLSSKIKNDSNLLDSAQSKLREKQQIQQDLKRLLTQEEQLAEYRAILNPGEPCQLCGSTEHPSIDHSVDKANFLDTQETGKRLQKLASEVDALLNDVHRYKQHIQSDNNSIEDLVKNKHEESSLLDKSKQAWEAMCEKLALNLQISDEAAFILFKDSQQARLQLLEEKQGQIKHRKAQVESSNSKLNQTLSELKMLESEQNNVLFALNRTQEDNKESIHRKESLDEKIQTLVGTIQTSMSDYAFSHEHCNDFVKSQHADIEALDKVSSFLQIQENQLSTIKTAQAQKSKIEEVLRELESPIAVLRKQLELLEIEIQKTGEEKQILEASLAENTHKRNKLLNGQSISQFLLAMSTQAEQSKELVRTAQQTNQKETLYETELQSSLYALTRELGEVEKLQTEKTEKWQQSLNDSIFDNGDAFLSAHMQEGELEKLQTSLITLENDRKIANARVDTLINSLQTITNNFASLPQLENNEFASYEELANTDYQLFVDKKQHLSQAKDALHTRIGEIKNKLNHDQKIRKEQAQNLLEIEKYQKEFDELHILNSLIGSAKGDSFRKFAQGLTLDHLVYLANQRLRQLHGRYELIRSNLQGLTLEVCDTWQADSKRNTKTLSGGESFLVSLALALGLSDLVSNKISIDSLFLDEGFGTLDGTTLDIALNALEQLNASGKMIGVISHIEGMKERIPIQIKVQKESGAGVSKLDDMYRASPTH